MAKEQEWGMVIDLDKCTGCQACTLACKAENNVPHGSPGEQKRRLEIYWHKVIAATDNDYPAVNTTIIPMPCMHCENPACVQVCPAKATYQREDGIVMQNFRRCLGCKYCIVACPYGARSFNYKEQEKQEYLRPDLPENLGLDNKEYIGPWPYPHRTHGVVEKCTFCFHRIDQGLAQNKKIGNDDKSIDDFVVPACVEACPAEARIFGNIEDPESGIRKLLASRNSFRLKEDFGTEPKVIYLSR